MGFLPDRVLMCLMCGSKKPHMDIGDHVPERVRWKCMSCGEYFAGGQALTPRTEQQEDE